MDDKPTDVKMDPVLDKPVDPHASVAERKAQLLRQGEYYRVGVVHAEHWIKEGARPEALFHSALDHATWSLRARVDSLLKPSGVNVATLAPYAVTAIRYLARRRLVKPALGLAAAAGGIAWYLRHRQANVVHEGTA